MNGRYTRLLAPDSGRLDEGLRTGELWPVSQALDHQVVERDSIGDQANDALGGLDRRHHDLRVEHQQADQIGGGDKELAAGKLGFAAAMFYLSSCPAMVGLKAQPELGVGVGDRREGLGVGGGLAGDRQSARRTLQVEVYLGDLEHCVVVRGPESGLVCSEDSPRRHRLKDRVRNPERRGRAVHGRNAGARWGPLDGIVQRRRSTEEQRAAVDRLDLAGDRLDLAVGSVPGRPIEERWQPEGSRRTQVGQGRENPLASDGDIDVAAAG